ncbi:MAG: hypothetical protein NE334_15855 [Lentisphaeraceae bacterium]|nr:hypothetical protein [Lentisphaeraceae bacterium]
MTLEHLATNRALQEKFVEESNDEAIKAKVYEVLDYANCLAAQLSQSYDPNVEEVQNLALRCCFFFLNQLGDRRLKHADVLEGDAREQDFEKIKNDFELVVRFTTNPTDMDAYFFKCGTERVFEVAVFIALSFMGGNPAIERVEEGAEERRLKCFELMMVALDRAR